MIIQNYGDLAKDRANIKALKILMAGLESSIPEKKLKKIIDSKQIRCGKKPINLTKYDSIYVVAFGKAADSMANTVNKIINIKKGIVVIPKDITSKIKNYKFQIFKSGHPIPNKTSVLAAKSIIKFLQQRNKSELVIFLVSGGSSALLALPDGITLNDKIRVTKELLASGATIQEINCVRKHLSKIKGGRLIQKMICDAVTLLMSDVVGDDLSSIASGTTYFDNTKFSNALKILKKYRLENKIPKSVIRRLNLGVSNKIPETPKKSKIPHYIVLTNLDCIKAMQERSKQLGIPFKTINISGDVKQAASELVSLIPKKKNSCIIFGGETTVKVKGHGKGGRNQELVLRILEKIPKTKHDIVIASVGTDGIDGNTKYAGAIAKNFLINQKDMKRYLAANDSNSFFKKYGGLIKTGHTHTNLMDIGLILT